MINRLTEFDHLMASATEQMKSNPIAINHDSKDNLVIDNLDLLLPDGTHLLKKFNLSIHPGEKVLISGQFGSGKSTLLRAMSGVWPYGHGKISLPNKDEMRFLPQKPYLPLGTLREVFEPIQNLQVIFLIWIICLFYN